MGFISFIVLGLICGAIAKAILSDRAVGGWLSSLIIGVIGAALGGWIGSVVFDSGLNGIFNIGTWVLAIVGSVIVLFVYSALTGKRRA